MASLEMADWETIRMSANNSWVRLCRNINTMIWKQRDNSTKAGHPHVHLVDDLRHQRLQQTIATEQGNTGIVDLTHHLRKHLTPGPVTNSANSPPPVAVALGPQPPD